MVSAITRTNSPLLYFLITSANNHFLMKWVRAEHNLYLKFGVRPFGENRVEPSLLKFMFYTLRKVLRSPR